jgi:serine/threonine protein kinase/Leucine-rich repeat (LRR) protein
MSEQGCPSRERIAAYLSSSMDERQAEELVSHLETCAVCQATLLTLSDVGDTLIAQLRSPRVESPYVQEPECQRAVERAAAGIGGPPNVQEARAEATDELPTVLGQLVEYQVLDKLGRGGMGSVYKALHTRLGRTVAVKVLLEGRTRDEQAVARFVREMKAVGGLSHPNIVQAHDARDINGTHVLVMEYVDGLSVGEVLRRLGCLPIPDACELLRQAATGLQYAHEKGLVHRDIKPSNLMLDRQGQVKILDLGLALLQTDQPRGEDVTSSGQVMGTADYMAPEQVNDSHGVDARADIYSLGCTLYAILTGRAPFHGDGPRRSVMATMLAHLNEAPAAVREVRPEVPPRLAAVLDRIMAKRREDRPGTAGEVAGELAPFCAGADLPGLIAHALAAPVAPAADEPEKHEAEVSRPSTPVVLAGAAAVRRRRIIWTATAAAAACAAIVLGIIIKIQTKDGQKLTIHAPPDSTVSVQEEGKPEVVIPGDGRRKTSTAQTPRSTSPVAQQPTPAVDAQPPVGTTPESKTPPADAEAERRMTQIALSFADSVAVQTAEGEKRILPGQGLPAGSFRLVGLRASGERATDAAFAQLAAARNLIEIWAVPAPLLTDAAMEHIASLPTLRSLILDGCRVTDAGVRRIARMDSIDNLSLRCVPITDVSLESIAKLPSLARLCLEGQGLVVTGAGLKHLQSHTKLRDLLLVALALNDADMEAVGRIKDLWVLNVQYNPIGDAGLERLKGLARLGVLDLSGTRVTSEGMRSLQGMTGLVNLSLDGTAVGDAGLGHLEAVQSLCTIRLDGTAVTDEGMKHLGAMGSLYHASLQNTRVSDAGLLHLAKLPNLKVLHLADTRVTDTGAKTVGQIASLTELYLSDTRVTDEGVRNLGSLPNLSKLYLVHTRVTDAVLEQLIAMPKVELLDLSATRISAKGIATLKAALPKAQILWSEPNRTAAEGVIGLGGTVSIRAKDRPEERPIKSAAELPAELFQVTRVSLAGVAQPLGQTLDSVALLIDPDFDRLESVDLSRTTFGDADLPRLTPLASLVDLSLAGTQITDQGLAQWKGPPRLRRLVLDGVPLRGPGLAGLKSLPALVDLQLACPTLTDFACKPLAELKSLKRLSLATSAVTDEGLGPLGSLQDLEELDLSGTKVTPQAVDALRKKLPKCRISLQQPSTKR